MRVNPVDAFFKLGLPYHPEKADCPYSDPDCHCAGKQCPETTAQRLPTPPVSARGEKTITDPETGGMKGQKLAQFSQIPPDVLLELAEHYGKGVAKYPDDEVGKPNWQRGYSWRLSVDALGRHLLAFLAGEDIDPDTGSSHLVAVMWHAMTLRWFQTHEKGTDYR